MIDLPQKTKQQGGFTFPSQKGIFTMYDKYNTSEIILEDKKSNGQSTDWRGKKINTIHLSNSYERIGYESKASRVGECGDCLEFRLTTSNTHKLTRANFCKVRLCPMCAWRRSLKVFGQVSRIMDYVEKEHDYRYIFLTLTVKNCYQEDLKDTLDLMTSAFNKMTRKKAFKDAVKGYFRALEVTYNKTDDSYHPHFHMILAVNDSYFKDTRIYLSQKDWTDLWQSALQVDYTPIVDVRALKKNKGKEVSEVAKYTVKADDYLIKDNRGNIEEGLTDRVVATLDNALHKKRLIAFGFKFKEVHKALNLDDTEEGDLINTENDELREDLTNTLLKYQWCIGIKNYILTEVSEVEEKEEKEEK